MKKIIVIQTIPVWLQFCQERVFNEVTDTEILYTDSFDHALHILPEKEPVVIITSNMFHDEMSRHHKNPDIEHRDEREKDATKLAEYAKKKNPQACIYILGEHPPTHIDDKLISGVIEKKNFLESRENANEMKKALLEIVEKEMTY